MKNSKDVRYFKTKEPLIRGTSCSEVFRRADQSFSVIKKRTKRQPYIRSAYFNKDKIFFNIFWQHLFEKPFKVRVSRLKLFLAAIDLMKNSRFDSQTKENPDNRVEILHWFYGKTLSNQGFVVQIKENKRTKAKHLISIFMEG